MEEVDPNSKEGIFKVSEHQNSSNVNPTRQSHSRVPSVVTIVSD